MFSSINTFENQIFKNNVIQIPQPPTDLYIYNASSNNANPNSSMTVVTKIGFTPSKYATLYTVYNNGVFAGTSTTTPIQLTSNLTLGSSNTITITASNMLGTSTPATMNLPIYSKSITNAVSFNLPNFKNNTLTNTGYSNDQNDSISLISFSIGNARTVTSDAIRGYVFNGNNSNTNGTSSGGLNFQWIGSSLTNFSWSFWIQPKVTVPNASQTMLIFINQSSTGIGITTNRFLYFVGNVKGTKLDNTTQLTVGTWYHIGLTFNSGTYNLYLNGNLLINQTGETTPANLGNNIFGSNNASSFAGNLSTILYFSSTLSQADMQNYMRMTNY